MLSIVVLDTHPMLVFLPLVTQENAGAGTIFVNVLWAMVVLVGCSMSLGVCMVAYRHFKAGGGGAPMYLPVQAAVSFYSILV